MKDKLNSHKTLFGILLLGITALFLPIILLVGRDITNLNSRAALPNNLEAEGGVLSSSGVNMQNDSGASGGQYVLFKKSSEHVPIAHWKMDGNANDSSGNGYNGFLDNGASFTTGVMNQALELTLPNQFMEVSGLIGSPQNITIMGWVNLSTNNTAGSEIISLGDSVGIRINGGESNAGVNAFYFNGIKWNNTLTNSPSYLNSGWHHFVYTIDSVSNTQTVYVDGDVVATSVHTDRINYSGNGSDTFIGKHGNGGTNHDFGGQIDDVRVYNAVLSAAQIQNIYSSTPVPPVSSATPTNVPSPTIPANAVYLPDSIDTTGSKNVQAELYNFIKNTPNGSTIVFKKNGIYRLGKVLQIINKKNMVIEGNGATLKLTSETASSDWWASGLYVEQDSENVTVRNLNILGDFALGGTPEACCSREAQHGMGVYASKNILIENVDISYVGGDCITVYPDGNSIWNDGVIIRNSVCKYTGKRAVSVKGSSNVLIENNFFDELGYAVIGSEPGVGSHGVTNLTIRNNTIGRYSLINSYIGALYYYSDAPWCEVPTDMQNITITGNTVEGNPNGKTGAMMGIDIKILDHGDGLRKNITVTNNIGKKTIDTTIKRFGSVMRFENVDGVIVTGNTQSLSAGTLVTYTDSTNVNISNNITN